MTPHRPLSSTRSANPSWPGLAALGTRSAAAAGPPVPAGPAPAARLRRCGFLRRRARRASLRGVAGLLLGGRLLIAHIIQHLLLMFAAPSLYLRGARRCSQLLVRLPPPDRRVLTARRAGQRLGTERLTGTRPLRGLGAWLLAAWCRWPFQHATMLSLAPLSVLRPGRKEPGLHIWPDARTMFRTGVLSGCRSSSAPRSRRGCRAVPAARCCHQRREIGIAMTLIIFVRVGSRLRHIPGITLPTVRGPAIGRASCGVRGTSGPAVDGP